MGEHDDAQRAHVGGETYREGEDYSESSETVQTFYDAVYNAPQIQGPRTEAEHDAAPFAVYPWRPDGESFESVLPLAGPRRYRRLPTRTHSNPRARWSQRHRTLARPRTESSIRIEDFGACSCRRCTPPEARNGRSLYPEERAFYRRLERHRHLERWEPVWIEPSESLVFQYPWEDEGYELGYRRDFEKIMRTNRGGASVSWEENREQEEGHHRATWDFPTIPERTWSASGHRPGAWTKGETDEFLARERFEAHLNGDSLAVVRSIFQKDGRRSAKQRAVHNAGRVAIVALFLEGFNTATIAAVVECTPRTVQRVIQQARNTPAL